jgi:hypothetical protein
MNSIVHTSTRTLALAPCKGRDACEPNRRPRGEAATTRLPRPTGAARRQLRGPAPTPPIESTNGQAQKPSGRHEPSGGHGAGKVARRLPREAREGMLRAWLEILRERRPGVTWIAVVEDAEKKAPSSHTEMGLAFG